MKFGIMDGILGSEDSEVFERGKRLGFDGIEIDLKISHLRDSKNDRGSRLRELSQKHGLPIPSAVLSEHNSGGIATWWRGAVADEEIRLAIDFMATIGATTLLVPFFFFNEPKGATHRRAVAERIKPLAEHAGKRGVWFAFEGVNRAEELREMAAQIKCDHFGVYFDMANVTWCDHDAPSEIRALGSLIRQSHAKEANKFTGDAHLGAGRVNHAACADAFKAIGYDRWIVLETPRGTDEEIKSDLAFSRRIYCR
jgi:sugar phosphate isomerase/epimerase